MDWMLKRSRRNGKGYEGTDPFADKAGEAAGAAEENLPNIYLAFLPSVVLLILLNIVKVDIIWALLAGSITGLIVFRKFLPNVLKTITIGGSNSAIPLINTCADVGFGTVVGAVLGFKLISDALLSIPGTPLISLSLATQLMCGVTGSASGGLGIAMELFAKQYLALGINPEVIHRVASIATAGLDVMPHNGAVITTLAVVGLTHKEAYKPIFILALLTPMLINAISVIVATFLY